MLERLVRAGMDVARLNFSHGTHEYHRGVFDLVRELSRDLKSPVSILQDLQGPKIRVGRFENGSIELIEGNEFVITMDDIEGNQERVSTTYKDLAGDVRRGDILLLDDGRVELEVDEVVGKTLASLWPSIYSEYASKFNVPMTSNKASNASNASNAPFRLFKHWVHEGGISTPLIVSWPDRVKATVKAHEPCHVVDILPTILAAASWPRLNAVVAYAPTATPTATSTNVSWIQAEIKHPNFPRNST